MDEIEVTIRIEKDQAGSIDEIAGRLEALGLRNAARFERLRTICGRLDAERLSEARSVPGVASIRKDSRFRALG
jgi:hypothetical protein